MVKGKPLSALINARISEAFNEIIIGDPSFVFLHSRDFYRAIEAKNHSIAGVFMHFLMQKSKDNVTGNLVLYFEKQAALQLSALSQGVEPGPKKYLDKRDLLQLKEITETLLPAYIQGLSDFFEIDIKAGTAKVFFSFDAFLSDFLSLNLKPDEKALLVKNDFIVSGTNIRGKIILSLFVHPIQKLEEKIRRE